MPIYEYQCKSCGHEFEAIQKISDDPLKECPACGDLELNKLVSAAGFRLKGGGWYETDFKGGKDKKKNLAGDTSDGKSDSSTAKKETQKSTADAAS
ncbi:MULTISPECIES: FmdB family zinc ribbon protein [Methylocaldum]|jgi:putative FmdB family regulatory protein|uniref:FmdB family zinc ribbon protein n=1 Tax=unclassified Methylocaldum TaxID=2622260 RepID=UPI00098ACC2E|nr:MULTISPECIES: zinc ribbon domain-containing protein [unclassified Methylocaldum]MBP1149897.1 putative FmdB family regulatory protein [Methylocaldum sp. RMAD-M]MVF21098.1 zinc ribbon domain-containing protein [Methylocaldum sp. BRCS4]